MTNPAPPYGAYPPPYGAYPPPYGYPSGYPGYPAPRPTTTAPLRLGDRVQIVLPGSEYDGVVGTLVKRGRTRYHLRVDHQLMTVPFALVRPAAPMISGEAGQNGQ